MIVDTECCHRDMDKQGKREKEKRLRICSGVVRLRGGGSRSNYNASTINYFLVVLFLTLLPKILGSMEI